MDCFDRIFGKRLFSTKIAVKKMICTSDSADGSDERWIICIWSSWLSTVPPRLPRLHSLQCLSAL